LGADGDGQHDVAEACRVVGRGEDHDGESGDEARGEHAPAEGVEQPGAQVRAPPDGGFAVPGHLTGYALRRYRVDAAKQLRGKPGKPDELPHTGCLRLFVRRRQAQLIRRFARRILPFRPLKNTGPYSPEIPGRSASITRID
jgi:hypothetical protein